jgi:DNA-binding HxlR family transcriptional regulator
MPELIREDVERCPVFIASQVLGKKWAILVLQELMTPEARNGLRFNQIQKDLDWITPKVLIQRLRDLMKEDIIQRIVDSSTIPPKVWYELTEKGEGLRETLTSMQKWGRKFGGHITAACIRTNFEGCKDCRSKYTKSQES